MTDVKVVTTAGFLNEGVYAKRNSEITVSQARAKELLRNGLIHDPAGAKAAPEPDNKAKPKPNTKSGGKAKSSKTKAVAAVQPPAVPNPNPVN